MADDIFRAALGVASGERHSYVAAASHGDEALRAEIEHLLVADGEAETRLNSHAGSAIPHFESSTLVQPGDILCGRFRIVRAIGRGGMGQVFEAWDAELAVRVAVKVIHPDAASDEETLSRFRQEVRLARKITHPAVCRTFDLEREARVDEGPGKRPEIFFLTMEYLEGETLAARIARAGPLPLDEALHIARQIADGLQAAGALGIVHRDMKPANIMLVAAEAGAPGWPRAVIMDFGLARGSALPTDETRSNLSQAGRLMGTLAYMAPEQLEGGPVSARTDIYALGLILFEMTTGMRAFRSGGFTGGIARRIAGAPSSPEDIVPGLPAHWRKAIDGCLRTNPSERFQSAAEVVSALEGVQAVASPTAPPTTAQQPVAPNRRWSRRAAVFAAVLLAVTAIIYATLRPLRSQGESPVAPGASIYLAPVSNTTGEARLNDVTELLRAGLAQSAQVNLLDQGRAREILEEMTKAPDAEIDQATAREIAMRAGAARVVFATASGASGSYKLTIEVQQPDNTPARYRKHWTAAFAWHAAGASGAPSGAIPAELLAAVRDASDWVRLQAGESRNDIARLDAPPADVTTSDWEALSDYALGNKLAVEGRREEAVDALQSAIRIDPQFALAYAALGDLQMILYRPSEGLESYRRALEGGAERRLSLRERARIKGMLAHDTGDFENCESVYRDYTIYYPNDYLGWFRRGRPLLLLNRANESIEVLDRAHRVDPDRPGALVQILRANLVLGNTAAAGQNLEEIRRRYSPDVVLYSQGTIEAVQGDDQSAAESFEKLAGMRDSSYSLSGLRMLADLRAEQGNYAEAEKLLSSEIDNAAERPGMLIDRAWVRCRQHETSLCISDLNQALHDDRSPQSLYAASAVLGNAIALSSGADRDALRDDLRSLDPAKVSSQFGTIAELEQHRLHGEVLLADRRYAEAISEFRQVDTLDAPFNSREYLARALAEWAKAESSPGKADALRREAAERYATTALHRAVVWQFPQAYLPGFYADQLEAWLEVSAHLSPEDPQREAKLAELSRLRPGAAVARQSAAHRSTSQSAQ